MPGELQRFSMAQPKVLPNPLYPLVDLLNFVRDNTRPP
jgi:hypothetical protein